MWAITVKHFVSHPPLVFACCIFLLIVKINKKIHKNSYFVLHCWSSTVSFYISHTFRSTSNRGGCTIYLQHQTLNLCLSLCDIQNPWSISEAWPWQERHYCLLNCLNMLVLPAGEHFRCLLSVENRGASVTDRFWCRGNSSCWPSRY